MINRKNLPIIFLFIISVNFPLFSQFGVGLSLIKPSGSLAYGFKTVPAIEFCWRGADPDDRFQYGGSIGYYKMNSRQDTMPTYAIRDDGGIITILPGWETVKNFNLIPLGIHADFRFLKKKFRPFIGLDFYANFYSYKNHYFVEGDEDMEDDVSSVIVSLMPKAGVFYQINEQFDLSFGIGKSMGIDFENHGHLSWWKTYFCLFYNI